MTPQEAHSSAKISQYEILLIDHIIYTDLHKYRDIKILNQS